MRFLLTICVLFAVRIMRNWVLGAVLLAVMCFMEAMEYRQTKEKPGLIAIALLFLLACLLLRASCFA